MVLKYKTRGFKLKLILSLKLFIYVLRYLTSINVNEIIIYDDGIFHNISGIAIEKNYKQLIGNCIVAESCISPISIVYCKISIEENYLRRKGRIDEGRGTFFRM